MSVLIKGMEMPPTCRLCKFGFYDRDWKMYLCDINDEIKIEKSDYYTCRHPKCHLVDVPTPHGRLIDADKLNIHDVSPAYGFCVMGVTEENIRLADAVIEAESEE